MKKNLKTILAMGALLACLFSVARAEEPKSPSEKYFTDTELVNQDGKPVRFYSDVLKGKTVVIDVFFTTCTASCLVMNKSFEKIQEGLGEHVGKEVVLVSITVDPETDTPERLKVYAKKFNAKPGWMFLTGKKENIQTVLKKLGLYVEDKNAHSNLVLIGNDATGLWKKAFGLAEPEELLKVVESVTNDK
jgi:protein SCO1/2